jgi:hypothetical protein
MRLASHGFSHVQPLQTALAQERLQHSSNAPLTRNQDIACHNSYMQLAPRRTPSRS